MVKQVTFIGAGSMAEALIAGMINKQFLTKEQIIVTNKENEERLAELETKYGVVTTQDKEKELQDAEIVIYAIKSYDLDPEIEDVKPFIKKDQLILSVIAGISTEFISDKLEQDVAVIRTMPNTSATIGYSATAIAKGKYANDAHIDVAKKVF